MSISCPNCGVEIVGVVIGSPPFPGWGPSAQTGANGRNPETQSAAQFDIARSSEVQSSKPKVPYNQGYTEEFLRFWKVYPLKRNKRKAYANWRNAIRRNSPEAILAGAIRYRDDPNRRDEFTKYAEGWLNGDGWEDEPLPARLPRNERPDPPRPLTSGEASEYIRREIEKARDA